MATLTVEEKIRALTEQDMNFLLRDSDREKIQLMTKEQVDVLRHVVNMPRKDCRRSVGGECPIDAMQEYGMGKGVDTFLIDQGDGRGCSSSDIIRQCMSAIAYYDSMVKQ